MKAGTPEELNKNYLETNIRAELKPCQKIKRYSQDSKEKITNCFLEFGGFRAWKKIFLWNKEGKFEFQRKKPHYLEFSIFHLRSSNPPNQEILIWGKVNQSFLDQQSLLSWQISGIVNNSLLNITEFLKGNGNIPADIMNELKAEWESCLQDEKYSCCCILIDMFDRAGLVPNGTLSLIQTAMENICKAPNTACLNKPEVT